MPGLLGGAVYVNSFTLVAREVDGSLQEFALAATSVGESIGTLVADISGVFSVMFLVSCVCVLTCVGTTSEYAGTSSTSSNVSSSIRIGWSIPCECRTPVKSALFATTD